MLSLSLITLGLATIGAYAKPTTRTPGGLEIYLSTPTNKVGSVADLRVVAIVKNAGNEDLKILKLGTVLDIESPIRPFIVSKDGKEIPFTGSTAPALDQSSEKNWIVIHPGENATAEHDVSTLYDLSANGPGTFTFDPVSTFQVMGPDHTVKTDVANVYPISVSITDDVSKRELNFEKRQEIVCPEDRSKLTLMLQGWLDSSFLAATAVSYLNSKSKESAETFKIFFGDSDRDKVIANFRRIQNSAAIPGNMLCSDPSNKCSTITAPAYVTGNDVHLCNKYFSQRSLDSLCQENIVNARNILGGTALSQAAEVLGIGGSQTVGCGDSDRNLRDDQKIQNADNYQCLAAWAYIDTTCPGKGGSR